MNFLKNAWYVAAWNSEIQSGQLFKRTLLNQSLVFFRDTKEQIKALLDRCPHRFSPLSMGKLCGESIQCPYHGLQFDGSGACTHNPHGDHSIPRAARVQSYITAEKHSLVWIWMGDADKADEALIPDFSCLSPDKYYIAKRYLHMKANYILETDNIMDLSHIQFLHPTTLGSDSVSQAVSRTEQKGSTVWSYRMTNSEILPEFLYSAMGIESGTLVDRWIDVRWDPPSYMLLQSGAVPTGCGRHEGAQREFPHLFTPETDSTTHYWFGVPVPLADGDAGIQVAEHHASAVEVPFSTEDLPMLEAQQLSMGGSNFWELKPVLLVGDSGAVRARRVLDKLIDSELSS